MIIIPSASGLQQQPKPHQHQQPQQQQQWLEQTQTVSLDVTSFILPDILDTTLPLSDELHRLNFSTAQFGNDFNSPNSEHASPEMLGGINEVCSEEAIDEDPNMFDNSNDKSYNMFSSELDQLPATTDLYELVRTSAVDSNLFHAGTETSYTCSELDDKQPSAPEKRSYFSVFDFEEPRITDDLHSPACFTDMKLVPKEEMEVAAEEEVVTEDLQETSEEFCYEFKNNVEGGKCELTNSWMSITYEIDKTEVEPSPEPIIADPFAPSTRSAVVEVSDDLNSLKYLLSEDPMLVSLPSSRFSAKNLPHLDITAAMAGGPIFGSLPDTPEVLNPVLRPNSDFDLLNFVLDNDSNNNTIGPATSGKQPVSTLMKSPISIPASQPHETTSKQTIERHNRQGKSRLYLQELKANQKRYSSSSENEIEPSPGTSSSHSTSSLNALYNERLCPQTEQLFTNTGRPQRESAFKFNKRLEEIHSILDSNSISSDDEDTTPKHKRRRMVPSLPRKRQNSDSEMSNVSVSDDKQKYRERRDRNNLSSKKSREKRKLTQDKLKSELKKLEEVNSRLRRKEAYLEALQKKVQQRWEEYLRSQVKSDDND